MQFAEQDSGLPEDLLRLVQPVRKVQTRSQDLGEATGRSYTLYRYCAGVLRKTLLPFNGARSLPVSFFPHRGSLPISTCCRHIAQ